MFHRTKFRSWPAITMLALLGAAFAALLGCRPTPTPQPTAAPSPTAAPPPTPTATPQPIALTLGGWRTSTERLNRILDVFHQQHSQLIVHFDPTLSGEYDAVIEAQLENGAGPDLLYLRSFSASRGLYERGYLVPLADLPGLEPSFGAERLDPWTAQDGTPYGVPLAASSHGIYYNQDLFQELGLDVPQTWEALLDTAERIRQAGTIPFANGTMDGWAVAEIVFMNLAPNFIGGREGRMAYLAGERCFDDAHVVAAFQAVQDLAPYLPPDHRQLGYVGSLELFVQGQAAMWMSGSWDIPYFEDSEAAFEWSVFALPPPAGRPGYVVLHPDVAIGLNAASDHQPEARVFLEWLTTPEFAVLLGNEIPGYIPMHRNVLPLENEHVSAFLALNQGRGTDVRFAWEKLGDGTPSGYALMQEGTQAVLWGEQTPQQAAGALQAGLAEWFEPAQNCPR